MAPTLLALAVSALALARAVDVEVGADGAASAADSAAAEPRLLAPKTLSLAVAEAARGGER